MTTTSTLRRRRAALPALAALAGLAALGCDGAPAGIEPPERVFLIVIDTLRADHLGAYGYPRDTSPFLDTLAAEGVLFERAIAQWPSTATSMASMFTGRYPQSTGMTHKPARLLPPEYSTLPELFRDAGFTTLAAVGNAVLSSDLEWSQGFDAYAEPWKWAEPPPSTPLEWRRAMDAETITGEAIELLEANAGAEKLFLWLQYLEPHTPYVLPEGEENPFLDDEYYVGETQIGPWFPKKALIDGRRELDFYIAQYDANVRVADRWIERLFARAEELGLLENAMVVVTSDHGESLGEHGELSHGPLPYNSSSHVPLIVWSPDRVARGRRVEAPVELVDLYPTLAELVAPKRQVEGLEGHSLVDWLVPGDDLPEVDDPRFRVAFSEAGRGAAAWNHFRAVQSRDWKLVYHPEVAAGGMPLTYELYHLGEDPGETTNRIDGDRDAARQLRAELAAWMERTGATSGSSDLSDLDEETLEALRALGYID